MKKIKFRAWSELENKMYDCDMEEDIQSYFKHDDGIVLMQYVGLKDKNGKEIYEGDIIKAEDKYIGVVKYSEVNAMYFISGSWFSQNLGTWEPGFLEIIGNKFENPELWEEI